MRSHVITSATNQKIKDLVRLKDRKSERAESEFLVEGLREIDRALKCAFEIVELFECPELLKGRSIQVPPSLPDHVVRNEISREAFEKVAVRDGSDGAMAVFKTKQQSLANLVLPLNPLIVAVEDVEKPGNLGAILRTADAAGVHAVIVLDHAVDAWNSNVIRASLGGVFSVPVIALTSKEFYDWATRNHLNIVAAALSPKSKSIFQISFLGPSCVLLGSEARGLSDFWLEHASELAQIPMAGVCDSLNVSVAAAIFIFESLRQRLT